MTRLVRVRGGVGRYTRGDLVTFESPSTIHNYGGRRSPMDALRSPPSQKPRPREGSVRAAFSRGPSPWKAWNMN